MTYEGQLEYLTYNDKEVIREKCELKIQNAHITVSYVIDDEKVLYRGRQNGEGHFELKSAYNDGRASLHRFPEGKVLVGYWQENGVEGFWRITVEKDSGDASSV